MNQYLDDLIPQWHRRERHRLAVDLPAAVVMRAVESLTWADVPSFRATMRTAALGRRPFPPEGRVLDMFLSNGFAVLRRTDDELVVGGIERISRSQPVVPLAPDGAAEVFRDFDQPGHLKLGFNFRFVAGELSTETRVLATDARSRRLFGAYWFVIRGGSGLIRHIWLRGIRRRAIRLHGAVPEGDSSP